MLASPANCWEQTFTAQAGQRYHLWVRLRAQNDAVANDSVHLQFSDAVTSTGSVTMRNRQSTDRPLDRFLPSVAEWRTVVVARPSTCAELLAIAS